jgi:uncharacterized protein with FMN-binding domain
MRKSLVIIFAVAILGGLSFYVNKSNASDKVQTSANPSDTSAVSPSQGNESSTSKNANASSNESFKDGTYTGDAAETPYGTVQVVAIISNGKITDIQFLKMPNDESRSRQITSMAQPMLKESAINRQSAAGLDMVTGATSTFYGYQESLQAALDKAKVS